MHQTLSIIIALIATSVIAAPRASADDATVKLSGGLGLEAISFTDCHTPGATYSCPDSTQYSLIGAAPIAALSFIKKTEPKRGWALRFGPELTGSVVGNASERGVVVGGMMTVGVHFHRLFGEVGGGLSALSLRVEEASGRTGTMYLHSGAGFEINPSWSITARADVHVMMHSSMGAGMLGAGLTYTPGR